MELNERQRYAVEKRGRLLVSAAAGTGKTTTMVEKIVRTVASGVPLKNILVLVFGNAAAAEIRQKVAVNLYLAAKVEKDDSRRGYLLNQLDEIMLAEIKTVHAFCLDMLREYFEPLNLSPDFQIMSAGEKSILENRAARLAFDFFYEKGDELFSELAYVIGGRKEDGLKKIIFELSAEADVRPDPEEFFERIQQNLAAIEKGAAGTIVLTDIKDVAAACAEAAADVLSYAGLKDSPKYYSAVSDTVQAAERVAAAAGFDGLAEALTFDFEKPNFQGGKCFLEESLKIYVRKFTNDFYDKYQGWKELYGSFEDMLARAKCSARYALKLIEAAKVYRKTLQEIKADAGKITFNDLERGGVRLVDMFGAELRERFKYIFIDEYQDINPIQEYIIGRLLGENTFFVGDIKQSIYGFRKASPELFLRRLNDYDRIGDGWELNQNYRSAPQILKFVNDVFDAAMTEKSCLIDYKRRGRFYIENEEKVDFGGVSVDLFIPERSEKSGKLIIEGVEKPYSVLSHPETEDGDEISAARAQGIFIAENIKSILGKKKPAGGFYDYGDFAVLYRSLSAPVKTILETLAELGVPIEAASAEEETREESELLALLAAVDNPRQDIPLGAYLLSPFGGLSDADILRARTLELERGEERGCLYDCLKKYSCCDEKLSAALSRFENVRFKSGYKNVHDFISGVISDCGYEAAVLARPAGVAALKTVHRFLKAAEDSDAASPHAFLEAYDKIKEDEKKQNRERGGGGNTVTATTIHKSKGLEYEVVFVPEINENIKFNTGSEKFLIEDGSLIGAGEIFGIKYFDKDRKIMRDSLFLDAAKTLANKRAVREEMRLFYVAMTRAKSKLFLLGKYSEKPAGRLTEFKCFNDFLLPSMPKIESIVTVHDAATLSPALITSAPLVLDLTERGEESPYAKKFKEVFEFKYPYISSTTLASKFTVTELNEKAREAVKESINGDVESEAEKLIALSAEAPRADGRAEGTAYHAVMEKIPFELDSEEEIASFIEKLVLEGVLTAEAAALVRPSDILRCLRSDLIKLAKFSKCYREKPFMMYVPASKILATDSADKVLVQGVIDLLILGERNIIVDYKASLKSIDELINSYKQQLYLYKTAVKAAINANIDELALFSLKDGKTVFI
ncbi:MAG TPA: UvrD-helicase domain-containing protein [Eubacteriales bacterium]|nr:UvrD-helicase domain-containing protein [Eubacteriales bacterium]